MSSALATTEHIARAKEAVRDFPETGKDAKRQQLNALLSANPTGNQLDDFAKATSQDAVHVRLEERVNLICKAMGVDRPTGSDRLLAMQIGLLQEQNAMLQRLEQGLMSRQHAHREADSGAETTASSGYSALLSGLLFGLAISH